jgi:hypothetical protein
MDFDPHTGHRSFFRKERMTNRDGITETIKMTKGHKNQSRVTLPSSNPKSI